MLALSLVALGAAGIANAAPISNNADSGCSRDQPWILSGGKYRCILNKGIHLTRGVDDSAIQPVTDDDKVNDDNGYNPVLGYETGSNDELPSCGADQYYTLSGGSYRCVSKGGFHVTRTTNKSIFDTDDDDYLKVDDQSDSGSGSTVCPEGQYWTLSGGSYKCVQEGGLHVTRTTTKPIKSIFDADNDIDNDDTLGLYSPSGYNSGSTICPDGQYWTLSGGSYKCVQEGGVHVTRRTVQSMSNADPNQLDEILDILYGDDSGSDSSSGSGSCPDGQYWTLSGGSYKCVEEGVSHVTR